jgi:hypothetical protein
LLWVSTSSGFDPTVVAPAYDSPQVNFTVNGTTGTTYYIRMAFYDVYSKVPSGLNISAEQSVTIGFIGAGDIDPNALKSFIIVVASENLAAGDLVNVWNNAGVANARKADASVSGKDAHGFVLAGVSTSANATVYLEGPNTGVTGLTPGRQFLSDSTAGRSTSTAPTTATHVCQVVGFASSATSLIFERGDPVIRA